MELANRLDLEAKLAAKLSRLYGSHRRKIVAALKATGDPPDPTKIPASLWQEIEAEIEQQLAEEILIVYLLILAATSEELSLGLQGSTQQRIGEAYANSRARDIAQKMTAHSRERIAAGSEPLEVFSPDRAATVARTEVGVAQSHGSIDAVRSPEGKTDREAAELEIATLDEDDEEEGDQEAGEGKPPGKSRLPRDGDTGKKPPGKKPRRRLLVAYWRHSHIRPKGHAGSADKPCPICTPRLNKPESQWGGLMPGEAHPHCVLPGTIISARGALAATSVLFEGPAVRFTVGGRNFAVTEQHKFLGPQGFIAAASLCEGDYLVGCDFREWMSSNHPHNNYGPAKIEQVVSSLSKASGMLSSAMPVADEDFDGDERFFDGNVDVVYSDCLLRHAPEPSPLKHGHKLPLCAGWDNRVFDELSTIDKVLSCLSLSAHGAMGSSNLLQPLFCGYKAGPHNTGSGIGAGLVAGTNHCSFENRTAYTETLRGLQERFPGLVRLDQIENVERFDFRGHVYDLQTESGLYEIDGVLSSNCDCYVEWVSTNDTSQPSVN